MGKRKKDKKITEQKETENPSVVEALFKPPFLYILLGIILLLGVYLRFSHLTANPPPDLSYSLSPYTDEGAIAINARDKVLFGEWKMDDFFRMGISPLLSVVYFLIFKIFGSGFAQIRILPALLSLGTILLVFSLLKREGRVKSAVFSSFFIAIAYIYVMHNRLALEETSLLFFLFLSLFFLQLGKDKKFYFILCGFSFTLAFLFIKISGFFFFPVIVLEIIRWVWVEKDGKKFIQSILYFGTGLIAGGIIWFLLVFLPYKAEVIGYIQAGALKSSAGQAENLSVFLRSLITLGIGDKLFPRIFFIFLLSFIYILHWFRNLQEKIKTKASTEFIGISWLIIGMLFLSYPNYHPIRYQLILIPPMCFLAGFFVEKIMEAQKIRISKRLNPLTLFLQFGVLVVFIYDLYYSIALYMLVHYQGFFGIIASLSSDPNSWFRGVLSLLQNYSDLFKRSIILALLVLGAIVCISFIKRLRQGLHFSNGLKFVIIAVILFLVIFSNLNQYSYWSGSLSYNLFDISEDLSSLPEGSIIAGPWAATLSLETKHRAIMMQNFANKEKVIERFKPTHLIIFKDGWEDKYFKETYHELMKKAILIREYQIRTQYNKPLLLYELPRE